MRTSKYAINWELSNVKQDEVKKWAIYLHYAPEDGRVYVGKTSQKPIELRFADGASLKEGCGYKGRFREYLKTHRLEDMVHVVVDTTDDDIKAKELEEAYTELYQSTDPRYGFNSQVGDVPSDRYHEAVKEAWAEGGACREANNRNWSDGGACREANKKAWAEGGALREASKKNWDEGGALREANKKAWAEGGSLRESFCKYWYTIRHPSGEVTITDNLREFCRKYNLNQGHMSTRGYSKGYRVISKEPKNK